MFLTLINYHTEKLIHSASYVIRSWATHTSWTHPQHKSTRDKRNPLLQYTLLSLFFAPHYFSPPCIYVQHINKQLTDHGWVRCSWIWAHGGLRPALEKSSSFDTCVDKYQFLFHHSGVGKRWRERAVLEGKAQLYKMYLHPRLNEGTF